MLVPGGAGVPGWVTEGGGAGLAVAPPPGPPLATTPDGRGLAASATFPRGLRLEHADASATAHIPAASAPKPRTIGRRSAGCRGGELCRPWRRGGQDLRCCRGARRGNSDVFIWIPPDPARCPPVPQIRGCAPRPPKKKGNTPQLGTTPRTRAYIAVAFDASTSCRESPGFRLCGGRSPGSGRWSASRWRCARHSSITCSAAPSPGGLLCWRGAGDRHPPGALKERAAAVESG